LANFYQDCDIAQHVWWSNF